MSRSTQQANNLELKAKTGVLPYHRVMTDAPGRFFRQTVLGGTGIKYPSRTGIVDDIDVLIEDRTLGSATLVIGPGQSGRSWVLEQLAARNVGRPASKIQFVRISLQDGVPMIQAPGIVDSTIEIMDLAGRAAGLLGGPSQALGYPPFAPKLVGGIFRGGATVGRRWRQRTRQSAAQPSDLLRFVNSIKARKIVLLVDDLDEAPMLPLWWERCFSPLVGSLQTDAGIPISVVLTARPSELGNMRGSFPAESICTHENLEVLKLVPLAAEETILLTGPAEASVSELLIRASGGQPASLKNVWSQMRQSKVVLHSGGEAQGSWRLAPGNHHVDQLHLAGLRRRLPMRAGSNFDTMEAILAVAAWEGSAFTAEAIAKYLDLSPETVVRILDELNGAGDTGAVVLPIERFSIPGQLSLRRYKFQYEADRLACGYLTAPVASRTAFADLAAILMDLYGSADWIVAPSIANLLERSGDLHMAQSIRTSRAVSGDVTQAAAQPFLKILVGLEPSSSGEAIQLFHLLKTSTDRWHALVPDQLVADALAALLRFAESSHDTGLLALAHGMNASRFRYLSDFPEAVRHLQTARPLLNGNVEAEVKLHYEWALLLLAGGQLTDARNELLLAEAAALRVERAFSPTLGQCSIHLAKIAAEQANGITAEVEALLDRASHRLPEADYAIERMGLLEARSKIYYAWGQPEQVAEAESELAEICERYPGLESEANMAWMKALVMSLNNTALNYGYVRRMMAHARRRKFLDLELFGWASAGSAAFLSLDYDAANLLFAVHGLVAERAGRPLDLPPFVPEGIDLDAIAQCATRAKKLLERNEADLLLA